eukprot:m.736092 g.736092  ORF g.736092 m.736092 type:complete len:726 (+) comp58894_c0_seq2:49-2226(+)
MADKALTMMRLGEMQCFDEDQRIAIFELVKTGALTVEAAHAEVKRTRPVSFACKYNGSVSLAQRSYAPELAQQTATTLIADATTAAKKSKTDSVKVQLTVSAVGIRVSAEDESTLENDLIGRIAHTTILASDKKRVAYVAQYTRLGLCFVRFFTFSKSTEADQFIQTVQDRKLTSPSAVIKTQTIVQDADDESTLPLGAFPMLYLGSVAVNELSGDSVIAKALAELTDSLKEKAALAKQRKSSKDISAPMAITGDTSQHENCEVILVVSSEGLRIIDSSTNEIMRNVIVRAVSFSTELLVKKEEMFAFIEVDDRRASKTCHLFVCDKGEKKQASAVISTFHHACKIAAAEAKRRAGDPFTPQGDVEPVVGDLAGVQIQRRDLRAIKVIGAGQFGKVYLCMQNMGSSNHVQRAAKMLREGASDLDRNEFLREAEVMFGLGQHDNIAALIGVVVTQRPWLVVVDFCQYGDLSDVLRACQRKQVQLSLTERLTLATQLATGAGYLASKRYVHMDIAARNCLLHGTNVLKLADFGLTHQYDDGQQTYRQVGMMKLSVRWLAIDSFENKLFSELSDVWSFAVTVWEIFTDGLTPFKELKAVDVPKKVRAGLRLAQPPTVPADVWAMLVACWEFDRLKRPTFAKIIETLNSKKAAGEVPRDIGALLNDKLTAQIKLLTLGKSKTGSVSSSAGASATTTASAAADTDGLVGAIEDEATEAPQQVSQQPLVVD